MIDERSLTFCFISYCLFTSVFKTQIRVLVMDWLFGPFRHIWTVSSMLYVFGIAGPLPLVDNFQIWVAIDVDGKEIDGMTTRHSIATDKRTHQSDPSFPLGGPYFRNLRMLYAPDGEPSRQQ